MSMGFRADPTNTSAVISVAGTDQVVITNAGNVTANTFTGALAGNAATATKLSTSTGTAPSYSARAFVHFDGTRNVSGVADATNTNRYIRASGNVSNVVRDAQGVYTVNFAVPMPDQYFTVAVASQPGTDFRATLPSEDGGWFNLPVASSVRVVNLVTTGSGAAGLYRDATIFCVTVFR